MTALGWLLLLTVWALLWGGFELVVRLLDRPRRPRTDDDRYRELLDGSWYGGDRG